MGWTAAAIPAPCRRRQEAHKCEFKASLCHIARNWGGGRNEGERNGGRTGGREGRNTESTELPSISELRERNPAKVSKRPSQLIFFRAIRLTSIY